MGMLGCGSDDDTDAAGSDASSDSTGVSDAYGAEDSVPEAGADVGKETSMDVAQDGPWETSEDVIEDTQETDVQSDGQEETSCTLVRPYSVSDPECNECAQTACCEEVNACLNAEICDDFYVNCMLACVLDEETEDVAACIGQCDTDYPVGKALYDAAIGCVDEHCMAQCE